MYDLYLLSFSSALIQIHSSSIYNTSSIVYVLTGKNQLILKTIIGVYIAISGVQQHYRNCQPYWGEDISDR